MISAIKINPRVDIAFKKIFGVEENKDILMALLNAIVSEEDQIDTIELLNPYNERDFKGDKLSIVDIKARNKHTGAYFLVEMQLAEEVEYHKRSLFTWARMYSHQIQAGDEYDKLRKTIAIHILNFTCIDYDKELHFKVSSPEKYHHRFILMDDETQLYIHKDIEIHTLELSKFAGAKATDLTSVMSAVKNLLDAWIAVLMHHELLNYQALPKAIDTPEIRKALHVMETINFTSIERDTYNAHLDFLRMEAGAFNARFLKGMEKGRQEGREEGRREGREEGREEEKAKAYQEKWQIAYNLLTDGLNAESVARNTGLDLTIVLDIQRSLN